MTIEEFNKIKFTMVGHAQWLHEHTSTYASDDGVFGVCIHTPKTGDFSYGRRYRHWRIGNKIYKSKAKFLEALAAYNPAEK